MIKLIKFSLISNATNFNTIILDNSLLQSDDTRDRIYTIMKWAS